MFIYEVFELLSQIYAVNSEIEFCRDSSGRIECYLRKLRFKQKEPSLGTLASFISTTARLTRRKEIITNRELSLNIVERRIFTKKTNVKIFRVLVILIAYFF